MNLNSLVNAKDTLTSGRLARGIFALVCLIPKPTLVTWTYQGA